MQAIQPAHRVHLPAASPHDPAPAPRAHRVLAISGALILHLLALGWALRPLPLPPPRLPGDSLLVLELTAPEPAHPPLPVPVPEPQPEPQPVPDAQSDPPPEPPQQNRQPMPAPTALARTSAQVVARPPVPVSTDTAATQIPLPATAAHLVAPTVTSPAIAPGEAQSATVAAASRHAAEARAAEQSWQALLLRHLDGYLRYPFQARRLRQRGIAQVRFIVDRSGHVDAVRLERGSGHEILDLEAVAVVDRAQPLPPPPRELAGAHIEVVLPVTFRLQHR